MIFALLNIASDITLNIAWWTTKTIVGGVYNLLENNLLKKGCTKNSTTKENNIDNERITLLMDKIDILLENNNLLQNNLLENNLLENNLLENNLLEKGCAKTNN